MPIHLTIFFSYEKCFISFNHVYYLMYDNDIHIVISEQNNFLITMNRRCSKIIIKVML